MKRITVATAVIFVLFLSLIFVPIPRDTIEHTSDYISTEKETYDLGEDLKILLVNDGSATHIPLHSYLKIKNVDTGRTVYRYDGAVLFKIPGKGEEGGFIWDQTDIKGDPVPAGEYKANFLGHSIRFKIVDIDTEKPEFQNFVRSVGVIGSLLTGFVIARDRFEDDGK